MDEDNNRLPSDNDTESRRVDLEEGLKGYVAYDKPSG